MRYLVTLALFFPAATARAYVSVDCDVDVRVDARISKIELDQQVGSERLRCDLDPGSGEAQVHVVRMVKTEAKAHAEAQARADGRASARYSDSCSCSEGSCSTSGSGSDSCSDSGSDSTSQTAEKRTVFTVARAGSASLSSMGYSVSGEGERCELRDSAGTVVDLVRAIAIVTSAYSRELLAAAGADLAGWKRSQELPIKSTPDEAAPRMTAPPRPNASPERAGGARPPGWTAPMFDGRRP